MDHPTADNSNRLSARAVRPDRSRPAQRLRSASRLMALEPRMLFDGAALVAADAMQREAADASDLPEPVALTQPSAGARELLVIDPRVQGWEALANNRAAHLDLLVLDPSRDGVEQIESAVASRSGLAAIHVVSHGRDGRVELGASALTADSLAAYSSDLRAVGASLADGGDVLIYGCDIAAGQSGRAFLGSLSQALQRDVAASTDATGATLAGGDWDLEYTTGAIQAAMPFSAMGLEAFAEQAGLTGLLDLVTSGGLTKEVVGSGDVGSTAGRNAAIGEVFNYRITLDVPTGGLSGVRVVDTLDPGLALVGIDSVTATSGLSFSGGLPSQAAVQGTVVSANGGVNNQFTADLGTITKTGGGSESVTITYRAVVLNRSSNQGETVATSLTDTTSLTANGSTSTLSAPALTVVEPLVMTDIEANVGVVDAGDQVTYTVILRNDGGATAYDIELASIPLPAGLSFTAGQFELSGGRVAASGTALNSASATATFGVALDTANRSATITSLSAGDQVEFRFLANVTSSAPYQEPLIVTANTSWTSLPSAGVDRSPLVNDGSDVERSGASGVGSGLNNYAAQDQCFVYIPAPTPLLSIVRTSDPNTGMIETLPGVGDVSHQAAVGEIVRFRMVVDFPEGSSNDFTIRPNLSNELAFLNDGSATVTFISNNGFTTVPDYTAAAQQVGSSVATPTYQIPAACFTDANGTVLASGVHTFTEPANFDAGYALVDVPTIIPATVNSGPFIHFGALRNNDNDTSGGATTGNREYVVVEFNAVVRNVISAQEGIDSYVRYDVLDGAQVLAHSNTNGLETVEPEIIDVDKRVIATDGRNVTMQVTFSNSGNATAHNVSVMDEFAGATNLSFTGGVQVTTSDPTVSWSNVSDADTLRVDLTTIRPGSSVVVTYTARIGTQDVAPVRDATVTYTSLPDLTTGLDQGVRMSVSTSAGVVVSSTTGERDGSQVPAGTPSVNDYIDSDNAGLGVLRGTVWDDTNNPNGLPNTGEARLANVTVTLEWVGPGINPLANGNDGNAATTADNGRLTTTTDSSGNFTFAGLPVAANPNSFRVVVPTSGGSVPADLRLRFDNQGDSLDGIQVRNLSEAQDRSGLYFAYVQRNDPPVNTVPGTITSREDIASVALTGVSITDPDVGSGNMQVTLSIDPARGSLQVTPAAGVTGTASGATLTLTGTMSSLNTTLATLIYRPTANLSGNTVVTIVTNDLANTGDADGDGNPSQRANALSPQDELTDTDTFTVNLVPINDPPVNVVPTSVLTTQEDTPLAITTVSMSDVDAGAGIMSTRLAIDPGRGTLTVNPGATGVTGTFSGSAIRIVGTQTQINTVLATLVYTPAANFNGDVAVTMTTDDNGNTGDVDGDLIISEPIDDNLFDVDYFTIRVAAVNDPPVANPDTNGLRVDQPPVTGNVLPNDSDPDNDPLTVTSVAVQGGASGTLGQPLVGRYGTVVLNSDGTYRYTADPSNTTLQQLRAGQSVNDVFTYSITDGHGGTASTTLTIRIDGLDDPPVARPDTNALRVDQPPVTGNVLPNDSDPDNDPLTVTQVAVQGGASGTVGQPLVGRYGTVVLGSDGNYRYTVDTTNVTLQGLRPNQSVNDVFTYTIADGTGGTASTTLTITISGLNDPPVANPDTNGLRVDQPPVTGNVLPNDSDPDNDPLTVTAVARVGGSNGVVGQPLVGTYGTVTLNPDGSYRYVVDPTNPTLIALRPGQSVNDLFTYTISDGFGGTASTTLTIRIDGLNDPPLAVPDTNRLRVDQPPVTGNVLPNDSDPDNDPLTVTTVGRQGGAAGTVGQPLVGTYGTVTLNADGTYRYVVDTTNPTLVALRPSQSVTDVFTYSISDGNGGTASTTLTITIDGLNRPPVANPDTNTTTAGDPPITGTVITNDNDPDNDPLVVTTVTGSGGPATAGTGVPGTHGTVVIQPNGTYTYTVNPDDPVVRALTPGQTVRDVFTYTITDGNGGTSTTTLTITIRGINDPPVGVGGEITVAQNSANNEVRSSNNPTIFDVSDPDTATDQLTLVVRSLPENGTLTLNGTALRVGDVIASNQVANILYTPVRDLATPLRTEGPRAGTRDGGTMTFVVNDGQALSPVVSVVFNVRPNDGLPPPEPVTPKPPTPVGPISTNPLDPTVYVGPAVAQVQNSRALNDQRVASMANALDAGFPPPTGQVRGDSSENTLVTPKRVAGAKSPAVECEAETAKKPVKPKTFVKKPSVLADSVTKEKQASFSTQLKEAVKKFKPPVKPKSRTSLREC